MNLYVFVFIGSSILDSIVIREKSPQAAVDLFSQRYDATSPFALFLSEDLSFKNLKLLRFYSRGKKGT